MNNNRNSNRLQSEKGNVILISLSFIALISLLLLLNMASSGNLMNQMFYQSGAVERSKLLNTTLGLLNEQQICQALFTNGFNTSPAKIPLSTEILRNATTDRTRSRVESALAEFADFELKSVDLANPVILPASQGVQFKQFEASITVGPKVDDNKDPSKFFKVFGARDASGAINKDENLFFVVGTNNRCFFHRDLANPASAGLAALPQTCLALGGDYANARCNLREFKVDQNTGIPQTKPVAQAGDNIDRQKSDLSDALCQMETVALQKLGPHLMSQTGKKSYGWSSLCEKPQWAGCREGNNLNSDNFIEPGVKVSGKFTGWSQKSKDLGKVIRERSKVTVDRRVARALPQALASDAWNSTNPKFRGVNNNMVGLTNILGGALGASLLTGDFSNFAGIFAMNLVWGPVIGGLMMAFGPKCDKAELMEENRCVQGYLEAERMSYRIQKVRYTWRGPRCSWKNWTPVDPVIDENGIRDAALRNGQMVNSELDISIAPGISPEDMRELTLSINAIQTLPELFLMVKGFTNEDSEPLPLPPELRLLVQKREQQLMADLIAQVDSALTTNNYTELRSLSEAIAVIMDRAKTNQYPNADSILPQLSHLSTNIDTAFQNANFN